MSAEVLRIALEEIGIRGTVEARSGLALLRVASPDSLGDTRTRREAVSLAVRHGFTHLALELNDGEADGAALHSP